MEEKQIQLLYLSNISQTKRLKPTNNKTGDNR